MCSGSNTIPVQTMADTAPPPASRSAIEQFRASDHWAVSLAAESLGDAVVFRVRDTGPGIPEEELPHVFDRYRRGKHASWRGSGLGLAIARALVEAHGGRIWADSSEGEGTSVTFTLPASRGADGALAAGMA